MCFTNQDREYLWNKKIGSNNAMAIDDYGAIIRKNATENSPYAWEIDHIMPQRVLEIIGVQEVNINDEDNLRVIHKSNNRSKGDSFPEHTYDMTSLDGVHNTKISPTTNGIKPEFINYLNALYGNEIRAFIDNSRRMQRYTQDRKYALKVLKDMGWDVDY